MSPFRRTTVCSSLFMDVRRAVFCDVFASFPWERSLRTDGDASQVDLVFKIENWAVDLYRKQAAVIACHDMRPSAALWSLVGCLVE